MSGQTKVCTRCRTEKDLRLFSARRKSKDGLSFWCWECFKSYWDRRYYEKHDSYRNSHNVSRENLRERNARKVFEYLTTHPCIVCGESDPVVLEFDHRDRNDKIESVAILIRNSSWKRVESEIEKCDVLYANCHRRKTATEFNYKRYIFLNK